MPSPLAVVVAAVEGVVAGIDDRAERIKALFEIMDDDDAVAAEIEDAQNLVHGESQEADHGES